MANSNGWGQGANNNDIGWGQGAYNNTIGWGSIYANSYFGDTEILGNEGGITTTFETRIIADGGTYEADSCLVQSLNF